MNTPLSLKKKRVLLVIESSTHYGRGIVQGIARYIQEHNKWWVDIENRGIHEPPPPELKRWDGDGIICRLSNGTVSRQVAALKCPSVNLLPEDTGEMPPVCPDEDALAEIVLEHFLENGLKNVGFYSFGKCGWIDNRMRRFTRSALKRDIVVSCCPASRNTRYSNDPVWKKDYEDTLFNWLESLPRPIGIFAANDTHALRLISACRKLNLAVPEEIAILGVNDDRHLCMALTPTLSSVDLNSERIGYLAAELLDKKMNGKSVPKKRIMVPPARIVPRQTTDMLVIDNEDVVEALRFIREFATQGIGVRDVLESLQLSSRSLERGFRAHLGRTPEREIIRVRLNHAIGLLRDSNRPVAEVAKLSGFGSTRSFLQIFRRERGETPNQFRRQEAGTSFHYRDE